MGIHHESLLKIFKAHFKNACIVAGEIKLPLQPDELGHRESLLKICKAHFKPACMVAGGDTNACETSSAEESNTYVANIQYEAPRISEPITGILVLNHSTAGLSG
jgi:hypothetical protein